MLSGVLPYNGTTPVAVAMCHASAPLPSLRRANPAIPPTVERIVLRAMQKGPAVRYPSARAMRAALLAALGELQRAEASERATEIPCEEVTVPVAAIDQWRTLADALVPPAEPAEPPGAAEELAPDERLPDLGEQAFVSVGAAAAFHASGDISEDALVRLCTVLLVGMLLLLGIVILHGVV
jgi:serine/threonine-protein kinase